MKSLEFLRSEHAPDADRIEVLGLLQSTPTPTPNNQRNGGNWSHIHIDEFIIHSSLRVRGAGVGAWLLAKWLARQETLAEADPKPVVFSDREQSWLEKRTERVVQDADGRVEPYVTLCVDESNSNARRFYAKAGFTALGSSPDRCPGRIEQVIALRTLQRNLRGIASATAPTILGPAEHRVRISYSLFELESLLFKTTDSRKSKWDFDEHDLARARLMKDPAAMITEMIAQFYFEEFKSIIEGFVNDSESAALMPIGGNVVTYDVVRMFCLDRLLLWREPRVCLPMSEWTELRALPNYTPRRTADWHRAEYLVLFQHDSR